MPICRLRNSVAPSSSSAVVSTSPGETSREAQLRGRAVVDEIAGAGHRCAVLVSHGNLIALVLQSIDSRFDYEAWTRLTNPDLFRLVPLGDSYSVERLWEER